MQEYAIAQRVDPRSSNDPELDRRMRMLEERLRAVEQTVTDWQEQTTSVFEVADRLREQLSNPPQPPEESFGDVVVERIGDEIGRQVINASARTVSRQVSSGASSWFLISLIADLKDVLALTFDSGYKRSWSLSLMTPTLIAMLFVVWLFLMPIIREVSAFFLTLILFKLIGHEVARYRAHKRQHGLD